MRIIHFMRTLLPADHTRIALHTPRKYRKPVPLRPRSLSLISLSHYYFSYIRYEGVDRLVDMSGTDASSVGKKDTKNFEAAVQLLEKFEAEKKNGEQNARRLEDPPKTKKMKYTAGKFRGLQSHQSSEQSTGYEADGANVAPSQHQQATVAPIVMKKIIGREKIHAMLVHLYEVIDEADQATKETIFKNIDSEDIVRTFLEAKKPQDSAEDYVSVHVDGILTQTQLFGNDKIGSFLSTLMRVLKCCKAHMEHEAMMGLREQSNDIDGFLILIGFFFECWKLDEESRDVSKIVSEHLTCLRTRVAAYVRFYPTTHAMYPDPAGFIEDSTLKWKLIGIVAKSTSSVSWFVSCISRSIVQGREKIEFQLGFLEQCFILLDSAHDGLPIVLDVKIQYMLEIILEDHYQDLIQINNTLIERITQPCVQRRFKKENDLVAKRLSESSKPQEKRGFQNQLVSITAVLITIGIFNIEFQSLVSFFLEKTKKFLSSKRKSVDDVRKSVDDVMQQKLQENIEDMMSSWIASKKFKQDESVEAVQTTLSEIFKSEKEVNALNSAKGLQFLEATLREAFPNATLEITGVDDDVESDEED